MLWFTKDDIHLRHLVMLTSIEHEIHQAHKFCNAKQYLAFQLIYTQDENMSFMAVEISCSGESHLSMN